MLTNQLISENLCRWLYPDSEVQVPDNYMQKLRLEQELVASRKFWCEQNTFIVDMLWLTNFVILQFNIQTELCHHLDTWKSKSS